MSTPEREGGNPALSRLENAVDALIEARARARERAEQAEAQLRELEALLASFERGDASPKGLHERVKVLEEENADLSDRLERGRESVRRVLDKVRFLEERR
ncbi:MAG: hypothetical protein R3E10_01500 [Gemmatimonadota bacterium]